MIFSSPEFWVLIAFVLLIVVLGKRIYLAVSQFLDRHSQAIAHQLEEAQHLQNEAESLLKTYKTKYKNALQEMEGIQTFTEKEVADFKLSTDHAFRKFKKERDKLTEERIVLLKKEFFEKLRVEAVEQAFQRVEKMLLKDEKTRKNLTLQALQTLKKPPLTSKKKENNKKKSPALPDKPKD